MAGDYRLSPLTPAEYSSFSSQWLLGGWFGFVPNTVDNIEIFLLLLDRVTQSQGLFYFLDFCHANEQTGGAWDVWRRQSWDR